MNVEKLERKIADAGLTLTDFCEKIGMGRKAFWAKRCGKTEFTRSEIIKITEVLKLENPMEIFFAEK